MAIKRTNKRNFIIPSQGDCRAAGSVEFDISATVNCVSHPPITRIGQGGVLLP
jgi:hypothetical protein